MDEPVRDPTPAAPRGAHRMRTPTPRDVPRGAPRTPAPRESPENIPLADLRPDIRHAPARLTASTRYSSQEEGLTIEAAVTEDATMERNESPEERRGVHRAWRGIYRLFDIDVSESSDDE